LGNEIATHEELPIVSTPDARVACSGAEPSPPAPAELDFNALSPEEQANVLEFFSMLADARDRQRKTPW